jgi:hypothetical protein
MRVVTIRHCACKMHVQLRRKEQRCYSVFPSSMQGVVYDLKNLDAEGVSVQYGDITLKLPLASCRVKATSLKTWMLKVSLYNTVMSH